MYNFDEVIDRHHTNSLKFDAHISRKKASDLLPLWVADMDFPVPHEVTEALVKRAQHGIFGYSEPLDGGYFEAVHDWLKWHYGWETEPSWLVTTPGIVFSLAMAVRAYTEPGDGVVIMQPVYYPFSEVIKDNDRTLVNCPLLYDREAGLYHIDFDAFETAAARPEVKLFLLCNPHNPGGRVWTPDELTRLGKICLKHHVLVVSDEIHQDFARPGFEHTVYAALNPRFEDGCIICTSPGKTFNIAGLQDSNIFIPNPKLRARFKKEIAAAGYSQMNTFALVAGESCYNHGQVWLCELLDYLEDNLALLKSRLEAELPELNLMVPQSTYLAWIDCRSLGLNDAQLRSLMEDKARLWLDTGDMFGADGSGFIRINYATQKAVLNQAIDQLVSAIRD